MDIFLDDVWIIVSVDSQLERIDVDPDHLAQKAPLLYPNYVQALLKIVCYFYASASKVYFCWPCLVSNLPLNRSDIVLLSYCFLLHSSFMLGPAYEPRRGWKPQPMIYQKPCWMGVMFD